MSAFSLTVYEIFALESSRVSAKASVYFEGDGTKGSPYLIQSIGDMNKLDELISTDGTGYWNEYYKLTEDLDYAGGVLNPIGLEEYVYGNEYFYGSFDGGGHTISNFVIEATGGVEDEYAYGVFSFCYGDVYNLKVDHFEVNFDKFSYSYSPDPYIYIGGIAGIALSGDIANCEAGGFKVVDNGKIGGSYIFIGGICGAIDEITISHCKSVGTKIAYFSNYQDAYYYPYHIYLSGIASFVMPMGGDIEYCYGTSGTIIHDIPGLYGSKTDPILGGYKYGDSIDVTKCTSNPAQDWASASWVSNIRGDNNDIKDETHWYYDTTYYPDFDLRVFVKWATFKFSSYATKDGERYENEGASSINPAGTIQNIPSKALLANEKAISTTLYNNTISVTAREGFTFVQWEKMDPITNSDGTILVIYTARFKASVYNISYLVNNKFGANSIYNPDTYTPLDEIQLAPPTTNRGYAFLGWVQDLNDEPIYDMVIPKYSTGNKNFIAQFKRETCRLEFVLNSTYTIMKVNGVEQNSTYKLDVNAEAQLTTNEYANYIEYVVGETTITYETKNPMLYSISATTPSNKVVSDISGISAICSAKSFTVTYKFQNLTTYTLSQNGVNSTEDITFTVNSGTAIPLTYSGDSLTFVTDSATIVYLGQNGYTCKVVNIKLTSTNTGRDYTHVSSNFNSTAQTNASFHTVYENVEITPQFELKMFEITINYDIKNIVSLKVNNIEQTSDFVAAKVAYGSTITAEYNKKENTITYSLTSNSVQIQVVYLLNNKYEINSFELPSNSSSWTVTDTDISGNLFYTISPTFIKKEYGVTLQ